MPFLNIPSYKYGGCVLNAEENGWLLLVCGQEGKRNALIVTVWLTYIQHYYLNGIMKPITSWGLILKTSAFLLAKLFGGNVVKVIDGRHPLQIVIEEQAVPIVRAICQLLEQTI